MGKKLHLDPAAEKEAVDIGTKFMNSSDVVADMSRAYGADLSSVRIHTDESATRQTAERGVDAFSTGKDVFFARGAFNRSDPASRGLLAHELSHSLQQGAADGTPTMTHSAPMGAAQGGLLDWFRGLFGRRRQRVEYQGGQRDQSPEALAYMQAIHQHEAQKISQATIPQASPGQRGDAASVSALHSALRTRHDNETLSPIEKSNQGFLHPNAGTDAVANGLVNLGLRGNGAEKRAMDGVRGSLFTNLSDNIADYADSVEAQTSLGGVMAGLNQYNQYKMGAKTYFMNDELQQVSGGIMSIFSQYATSEEATSYFRDAAGTMQDAAVFQSEGGKNVYDALIEDALLRFGANPNKVAQREASQRGQTGAKTAVMTKAAQALMHVPNIAKLSPQEFEELPPQMKSLYAQYQALVAQIHENLGVA